jgi:hypothetical protein
MVGIDFTYRLLDSIVEGEQADMLFVSRLVQGVVPGHPDVIFVVLSSVNGQFRASDMMIVLTSARISQSHIARS